MLPNGPSGPADPVALGVSTANRGVVRSPWQTPRGWPQSIPRRFIVNRALFQITVLLLRNCSCLASGPHREWFPGPGTGAACSWLGAISRPPNWACTETLHHHVEVACAKSDSSRSQGNNHVTCADGSGSCGTCSCAWPSLLHSVLGFYRDFPVNKWLRKSPTYRRFVSYWQIGNRALQPQSEVC